MKRQVEKPGQSNDLDLEHSFYIAMSKRVRFANEFLIETES